MGCYPSGIEYGRPGTLHFTYVIYFLSALCGEALANFVLTMKALREPATRKASRNCD